jgi:hypothetical protein
MTRRSGSADLPLHGGRVPAWLGQRMARLGAVMTEAIVRRRSFFITAATNISAGSPIPSGSSPSAR